MVRGVGGSRPAIYPSHHAGRSKPRRVAVWMATWRIWRGVTTALRHLPRRGRAAYEDSGDGSRRGSIITISESCGTPASPRRLHDRQHPGSARKRAARSVTVRHVIATTKLLVFIAPRGVLPYALKRYTCRLPYAFTVHRGKPMAEEGRGMTFEDIPLEDARRMGRGPRMEPLLYDTLRQKI